MFGYPLIATLALLLTPDADTRVISLPYRGLVLAVTLIVLMKATLQGRPCAVPAYVRVLLLITAAVLTVRFVNDALILGRPVYANQSSAEVATFFYGVTLLPALALCFALRPEQRASGFQALLWTGALTVGLAVLGMIALNPDLDATARVSSEGLNAITFGTIGALLVLLVWVAPRGRRPSAKGWLLRGALVGLGLVPLVTSGSRGPIVCLVGTLALSHIVAGKSKRPWLTMLLVMGVVVATSLGLKQLAGAAVDSNEAVAIAQRLSDVTEDQSTVERIVILSSSWNVFMASPVLGGAMVEPVLNAYPHNILLEALMVGGLLFGAAILVLTLATALAAIRLLRTKSGDPLLRFIGVHALFVLGMSMLSGSLYRSPDLWAAIALTFGYAPIAQRINERRGDPAPRGDSRLNAGPHPTTSNGAPKA